MNALDQINKLNEDYKNGVLKVPYATYLKKHKTLTTKLKAEKRAAKGIKTLAEQMKEFGVKVTKQQKSYYLYKGKNFTVEFNEDACETTWWEVNLLPDDIDEKVVEHFEDKNYFERKKDLVSELFQFDKNYK